MQNCSVSFYSSFANFGGKITTKFKYYNKMQKKFALFSEKRFNSL